jgi:hypothetical protein
VAGSEGIDRRTLIKSAAVAGAAAWTAPVIIDSLASPAAATSGALPTGCSYALVVFLYNGAGPYIMRIQQGSASCTFSNSTSSDSSFNSFPCNGHTYQGGAADGAVIQQDGTTVPTLSSPPTCDSLFTVQGSTIVRDSSQITLLFAVSHHGGSGGWQGSKFFPVCPSTSAASVTVDCN